MRPGEASRIFFLEPDCFSFSGFSLSSKPTAKPSPTPCTSRIPRSIPGDCGTHPASRPGTLRPRPSSAPPRLSACCHPCCRTWHERVGGQRWAPLALHLLRFCLPEETSLGICQHGRNPTQHAPKPPSYGEPLPKLQGEILGCSLLGSRGEEGWDALIYLHCPWRCLLQWRRQRQMAQTWPVAGSPGGLC